MQAYTNGRRAVSVGLGLCAVAALIGLAPTPVTIKERFTDNSVNLNLWQPIRVGFVATDEDNKRLEFYTDGPTGSFSYGGLGVATWGANWKQDFEILLDYRLNFNAIAGDRVVWVGVDMSLRGDFPVTTEGYAAGVSRDSSGLHLDILRLNGSGPVQQQSVPISAASGTLVVRWDRSNDRLTARAGMQEVHLNGVWNRFGSTMGFHPMLLAIGCTTLDGNITFPGTRVYADNFQFTGVKKGGCAGCH